MRSLSFVENGRTDVYEYPIKSMRTTNTKLLNLYTESVNFMSMYKLQRLEFVKSELNNIEVSICALGACNKGYPFK